VRVTAATETPEVAADSKAVVVGDETQDAVDAATRLRLAADPAGVPHAVEVEGNGVEGETETLTEGAARLALDLEPGEYKFYCPVGDHEQAGMVGTLTVR
jgi:uncharacterized cupredoxin-like copper-binding protein